jgi:hypothetical protein
VATIFTHPDGKRSGEVWQDEDGVYGCRGVDHAMVYAMAREIERLRAANIKLADAVECLIIGGCAVAVPHAGERAVLQEAIDMGRSALKQWKEQS